MQYSTAAAEFLDHCGSLSLVDLDIELHLREPNTLYEGRDFALGNAICKDAREQRLAFSERWVRDGRSWYTRLTGFVTPALPPEVECAAARRLPVTDRTE